MHYTASGRPNARFVGTPACDAATGMVFSVPVDLLAVIPAEGETAEGHILGQVMMLLHPSAAHTSLHLDLSGVIGAQDVLLLDANGDTLFTYPVYGLRFDHIFTPCEEDGLDNVRAIAVSNAEQPNGAWREDPEWANEEGEVEGEGEVGGDCFGYECFYPGCELDWDVTIDYPGEVPPATVALVAMLPYGWTYAGAATNEGFTPPATVDESNQGLSIFFWNQPISFPFTTRLQLLPNGNPGDTQIGMRILIHDIIYSVNGEDYYSGAQFTALLSAPLPAPEEGSPECVSANPTAAATIDDPYPDTSIYYSGCDVNLDLAINYEGNDAVTALGLTVSLPDGWSYAGAATGSEYFPPPIPANTGATGTVGFAWIDVPEFPFTTRLTFDTSEADTGVVETLAYEVLYRTTGAGFSPLQQEKRYFGVALQAADCPSASGDIVDVTQGARWSGGGAPTCPNYAYSADLNGDYIIQLTELLRVIQFYNSLGYHCDDVPSDTEDGFVPGPGTNHTCNPYDTDYNPTDWVISLTELLRLIQFYNSLGYHFCPLADSEDGFCPGAFQSWSRILGTDGRDSGGQLALINEGDDILVAFSGRPSKTMLQLELIDSTKRVHPHVARVNEAGDIVGSQGIVAMSYIQGSEVGAFNVLPDASGYLLGTRMPSANYTGNMKKLGSLIGTTVNGYDSLSSLPIASAVPITSTTIAYVATPYPDVLASSNTPSRVAYVDTEDELNNWTDQSFGPKHPIYDLVLLPESATRRLVGVGAGPNANDQMQAELTAFDLQNQVARMGHFVFEMRTDQSELRAVSLAAEDRLIVVGSRFVTDHFEVLAAVTDLEGNVSAELTGTWVKSFSCMRSQWARMLSRQPMAGSSSWGTVFARPAATICSYCCWRPMLTGMRMP
jgi:hypothetical protein